jgi:hypothetical protein
MPPFLLLPILPIIVPGPCQPQHPGCLAIRRRININPIIHISTRSLEQPLVPLVGDLHTSILLFAPATSVCALLPLYRDVALIPSRQTLTFNTVLPLLLQPRRDGQRIVLVWLSEITDWNRDRAICTVNAPAPPFVPPFFDLNIKSTSITRHLGLSYDISFWSIDTGELLYEYPLLQALIGLQLLVTILSFQALATPHLVLRAFPLRILVPTHRYTGLQLLCDRTSIHMVSAAPSARTKPTLPDISTPTFSHTGR